jgi:hypothetical protein
VLNSFQLDYRMKDMTEHAKCGTTEAKTRCNLEGCHVQNRMFSWPSTQPADAVFDVGITIQQTFTTYLSEFYRAEPPIGFSAVPDA